MITAYFFRLTEYSIISNSFRRFSYWLQTRSCLTILIGGWFDWNWKWLETHRVYTLRVAISRKDCESTRKAQNIWIITSDRSVNVACNHTSPHLIIHTSFRCLANLNFSIMVSLAFVRKKKHLSDTRNGG